MVAVDVEARGCGGNKFFREIIVAEKDFWWIVGRLFAKSNILLDICRQIVPTLSENGPE